MTKRLNAIAVAVGLLAALPARANYLLDLSAGEVTVGIPLGPGSCDPFLYLGFVAGNEHINTTGQTRFANDLGIRSERAIVDGVSGYIQYFEDFGAFCAPAGSGAFIQQNEQGTEVLVDSTSLSINFCNDTGIPSEGSCPTNARVAQQTASLSGSWTTDDGHVIELDLSFRTSGEPIQSATLHLTPGMLIELGSSPDQTISVRDNLHKLDLGFDHLKEHQSASMSAMTVSGTVTIDGVAYGLESAISMGLFASASENLTSLDIPPVPMP
jgi:hypothetical protein